MARGPRPYGAETVVPFPNGGDALDSAGQTIFTLVQRAAAKAEEDAQHGLAMAHKLSLQLLEAQERIVALEAEVGRSRDQVYRAEQWMQRIAALVEQRFLNGDRPQTSQRPMDPPDYPHVRQTSR